MNKVKRIIVFIGIMMIISCFFIDHQLKCALVDSSENARDLKAENNSGPKYIALTFDDGPNNTYTPLLLDGLAKRGVKATFFLIETNIEGNEALVKRMFDEGHLIGNHTATHILLTSKTEEEACREIEETNQKIYEITGTKPTYIRPPFGSWSEKLECIIPMNVILWNIDPLDWKTQNQAAIVKHVVTHARNGGIILLHDSYKTSVDAALEIVDTLTREGYTFVTADELLVD